MMFAWQPDSGDVLDADVVKRKRTKRSGWAQANAPATIVDVAKAAGVSTATVSRALSNVPSVSAGNRKRVLQVAADLNYVPNAMAAGLRRFRTRKILVIIPNIANPFFAPIVQSIEDAASREGYAVLIGDSREKAGWDEHYSRMLLRQDLDGLIHLSRPLPLNLGKWIKSKPGPVPLVTGLLMTSDRKVSCIGIDDRGACYEGLDHLVGLGHRHIGVLAGPADYGIVQRRLEGIAACAKKHSVSRTVVIEHGEFSVESGIAMAARFLARSPRPTALFCISDGLAIGAMNYANRIGLNVPRELSVLGFDDIDFAPYLNPPLTTIHVPLREIGREAVRVMLNILDGRMTERAVTVLPHRLIIRASTAAPPS